jgi:hypothetical protein
MHADRSLWRSDLPVRGSLSVQRLGPRENSAPFRIVTRAHFSGPRPRRRHRGRPAALDRDGHAKAVDTRAWTRSMCSRVDSCASGGQGTTTTVLVPALWLLGQQPPPLFFVFDIASTAGRVDRRGAHRSRALLKRRAPRAVRRFRSGPCAACTEAGVAFWFEATPTEGVHAARRRSPARRELHGGLPLAFVMDLA